MDIKISGIKSVRKNVDMSSYSKIKRGNRSQYRLLVENFIESGDDNIVLEFENKPAARNAANNCRVQINKHVLNAEVSVRDNLLIMQRKSFEDGIKTKKNTPEIKQKLQSTSQLDKNLSKATKSTVSKDVAANSLESMIWTRYLKFHETIPAIAAHFDLSVKKVQAILKDKPV